MPRPLLSPAPIVAGQTIRWQWYAGLLVLCLIPRLVMAWKIDTLCPDAIVYIDLARAIEQGNWVSGLAQIRLNVFPLVLAALHRLGLDWMTAGELWNVGLASAAVIPLLSWVNQMFDRRTGLIAALLYCAQPALIERSPELLRDPTFWFAMLWSMDAIWRAVTRVRYRDFVVAGLAILLAALSRFEGLLLFVPLLLWSAMRFLSLASHRARLLTGVALAFAMLPLSLLLVQQVAMPAESPLRLIRLEPLARVQAFAGALSLSPSATQPAQVLPDREPLAKSLSKFGVAFLRGMSPLPILLIASGFAGWSSIAGRREHWPIYLLIVMVLAGSWFHLRFSSAISCRYLIPVFLLASPWAALGLTWPERRLTMLPVHFRLPRVRAAAVSTILVICLCHGWGDALATRLQGRREILQISRQIAASYGPSTMVFAQPETSSQVAFYSGLPCAIIHSPQDFATSAASLGPQQAVVVILDRSKPGFDEAQQAALHELGLSQLYPPQGATHAKTHWLVYGRDNTRPPQDRTAHKP